MIYQENVLARFVAASVDTHNRWLKSTASLIRDLKAGLGSLSADEKFEELRNLESFRFQICRDI